MEDKSKVIKNSFFVFMVSLFMALFFVNEMVMDYIISLVIRYLYFPTFASIILTLIISMVIFVINIYRDKINDKKRIINYIFASFIFIAYIILMLQDIDINSSTSLYTGDSLKCLRYISRTFVIWIMTVALIKYFSYFLKKKDK
jgi:hypothetical protein